MAFSSTTKYNYIDIVNRMVPEFYRETDFRLYGEEEDVSLTFLGKILKAAIQNDLYFDVSSLDLTERMSVSALAEYFIPNQQTSLSPNQFERRILHPYNLTFGSFETQEELKSWFSGTFLPDAELNNPSGLLATMSGMAFGAYSSLSGVHSYLVETLGMFYFMNTSSLSGTDASANASSLMVDYIIPPLYAGEVLSTQNALNALFRFFWEGREDSTYYGSFFPYGYASSTSELSSNTYLSGTQMFSAIQKQLESWTDTRLKNSDFFKDSLSILLNGSGGFPVKMRDAGPFQRFLKALSLGIADINLIIEEIGDLLSIDECPEKFLELLANNIGWQFLTGDYAKWRGQLRNAVMVYKTKGSVVGFDAACKLIFPDGVFAASSVVESWESYLPKLLYYFIKTESFIVKEGLEFRSQDEIFNGSFPSGVRFNQAPADYSQAKDRNYRFLVDAVLEDYYNTFSAITINGVPFREDKVWECLPVLSTGEKGYYHRNYPSDSPQGVDGFHVAVPPWEKYGFYKECRLTPTRVEFFCNVLSGSRNDFGFEVNESYVGEFKNYLLSAIEQAYSLTEAPIHGSNDSFRFFASAMSLPPNYSKFVEYGHTSALELFDTWCTKSSFIFGTFAASSLDYTVERYDSFRNKAALNVYVDILRTFLPLHVVARITLYEDLEDTHFPWSKLCIVSDECLDTFNTEYLRSNRTDFWAGASGTGDWGTTAINGDGRILPYWVSGGGNDFFYVSATDLNRNTSRRRNYRYALPCYPYTRPGKGQPIAMNHFGIATSGATLDEYTTTWEYISKGFRYDTQDYAPASSVVWDNSGYFSGTSCARTGLESDDYPLSSLYPARAVPNTNTACSSLPISRDNMKGIMGPMTSRTIRRNKNPQFSDLDYRSFEFGNSVHESYHIYKNEFSSILANTISPNAPFYGGYNFLSYAFGPTLWNSDFRYKGRISTNVNLAVPPLPNGEYPGGYEPQWSSVIGGTHAGGIKYDNYDNSPITISNRTYFEDAPDATNEYAPSGVYRDNDVLITNEILSGIQLRQPAGASQSFVVVNNTDREATLNATLGNSVAMFSPDGRPIEVVVPFDPQYADYAEGEDAAGLNQKFNKLRPQSQFKVDISTKTLRNLEAQRIAVELTTSGVLADDGTSMDWRFCWRDEKWIPSTTLDNHMFTKVMDVPVRAVCPVPLTSKFHTQDIFTVKHAACHTPFKTGDVHTSSTGYLLTVKTASTNTLLDNTVKDGIVIYEISVVDTVLNQSMNYFNSKEIDTIYTFWDGLTVTSYSRDATYSTSSFDVSGGSRAEYVELLGQNTWSSGPTTEGSKVYYTYSLKD